jgi:hypothetical protein
LRDYLTARLIGEQLNYSPQQGINDSVGSLKLEMTIDYPIRFMTLP